MPAARLRAPSSAARASRPTLFSKTNCAPASPTSPDEHSGRRILEPLRRPIGRLAPLRTAGEPRTVLVGQMLQRVHHLRVFEGFGFNATDNRQIAAIRTVL